MNTRHRRFFRTGDGDRSGFYDSRHSLGLSRRQARIIGERPPCAAPLKDGKVDLRILVDRTAFRGLRVWWAHLHTDAGDSGGRQSFGNGHGDWRASDLSFARGLSDAVDMGRCQGITAGFTVGHREPQVAVSDKIKTPTPIGVLSQSPGFAQRTLNAIAHEQLPRRGWIFSLMQPLRGKILPAPPFPRVRCANPGL